MLVTSLQHLLLVVVDFKDSWATIRRWGTAWRSQNRCFPGKDFTSGTCYTLMTGKVAVPCDASSDQLLPYLFQCTCLNRPKEHASRCLFRSSSLVPMGLYCWRASNATEPDLTLATLQASFHEVT